MPLVRIDASTITDFPTFHDCFADALGFPNFYGRNMDAWIDCLTSLDEPLDGMTTVHGSPDDMVVLHLENVGGVPDDVMRAFAECAAFVNWRRIEVGEPAILAVSFGR